MEERQKMIEIDGSAGEGGGQILRTALSLSMCTGMPLRITQIRAKRPKPGLMRQHLACVQAAQAVSAADVQGAEPGSQTLQFEPGSVRSGDYAFAIGTAGSCMLVLQTVLPALMLADKASRLRLSGGTHNPMAPSYHFIERAFAPLLNRMGVTVDLALHRHGFYPAGGGEIDAVIHPAQQGLKPFSLLDRGVATASFAECLIPGLPRRIAARELEVVGSALGWADDQLRTPVVRQNEGPGNALIATLVHEHVTEVFTQFGEKDVSSERVARQLVRDVSGYQAHTAAVGGYLADQLALPLALAVNKSGQSAAYTCTEVTEHTRTNFEIIQRFLPVGVSIVNQCGHWLIELKPASC